MIRVLLDEDLPTRLRHHFGEGVQVQTVEYRGWKGPQNGALLDAVSAAGDVDVLVTADRKMPSQQDLSARHFAVAVLRPFAHRAAQQAAPQELRRPSARHGAGGDGVTAVGARLAAGSVAVK